jgi:hypothetical protein
MMILKRQKCLLNSSDIPLSAIDHVTLNRGQFKKKKPFFTMKGRDNNASHLPYILTKGVYGSRK